MPKKKDLPWSERVRAIREAMGVTQEDFAELLGLQTRGAVSLLESGRREPKGSLLRLLLAMEKNPNIFRNTC